MQCFFCLCVLFFVVLHIFNRSSFFFFFPHRPFTTHVFFFFSFFFFHFLHLFPSVCVCVCVCVCSRKVVKPAPILSKACYSKVHFCLFVLQSIYFFSHDYYYCYYYSGPCLYLCVGVFLNQSRAPHSRNAVYRHHHDSHEQQFAFPNE